MAYSLKDLVESFEVIDGYRYRILRDPDGNIVVKARADE